LNLSNVFLVVGSLDPVGIVELIIMGFSIVLAIMAISAYKNTHVKKLGFAAIAFGLFAFQLFIEYADDAFDWFGEEGTDLLMVLVTLTILLCFFFGIIYKRKPSTESFH